MAQHPLRNFVLGSLSALWIIACTTLANEDPSEAKQGKATGQPAQTQGQPAATQGQPAATQGQSAKQGQSAEKPAAKVTQAAKTAADAFDADAFPPTVSDTKWHANAWAKNDCLRCHETGVDKAPEIRHRGLPPIAKAAKCRSCHVLIPGSKPRPATKSVTEIFDDGAFPPMMTASAYHGSAWTRDDCLLCHESGIKGAPIVKHKGLPRIALKGKCRTCHVQVRVVEVTRTSSREK